MTDGHEINSMDGAGWVEPPARPRLSIRALQMMEMLRRRVRVRISITRMRDPEYIELREHGLLETGQEMNAQAANFPAGPMIVNVVSVEPLWVWIQPTDKGWLFLAVTP